MRKFKGVFADNNNWFTSLIYILFERPVHWILFRLPFSNTGVKILVWFVKHDPTEYSGS